MKSEPDECSIDDALAAPKRITPWTGVRNYQARNFMRDADARRRRRAVLSLELPRAGHRGPGRSRERAPIPIRSQFDRKSPYYDPKSKRDAPRWFCVDVRALRKTRLMPLAELHAQPALQEHA